jgi:hemolysin activation/secretion protein
LRWSQPLPTKDSIQNFSLEADYKDFQQNILVSSTSGLATPIKYLVLEASYSGARQMDPVRADWTTSANFGIRGPFNNDLQFADKRFDATPNFFYLRSDGGVLVQLPAHLNLAVRLTGQYAAEPLISNEQLPIGGVNAVRGYLEAEELGDSVVRGSLQLGGPTLNLFSNHVKVNEYAFYDVAKAFTTDPLPGEDASSNLRSTGFGVTIDFLTHFYGSLTWAYPLVDGLRTERGDSTVLFVIRGYL